MNNTRATDHLPLAVFNGVRFITIVSHLIPFLMESSTLFVVLNGVYDEVVPVLLSCATLCSRHVQLKSSLLIFQRKYSYVYRGHVERRDVSDLDQNATDNIRTLQAVIEQTF